MPVTAKKIGKKWRVVAAADGQIETTAKGHAVDGGGHATREEAMAQARAINANMVKKKGEK